MALKSATSTGDQDGPGPWFPAAYGGECSRCGDDFEVGDAIRADGSGEWECCDEEAQTLAVFRERYIGTTLDEMGY